MRFIITALLVSFLCSTGFSQDLKSLVRSSAERTVTKEKLDAAKTMSDKIPESESKDFPGATIRFTVNEDGKTVNAIVYKTSGNPRTDNLLLKAINNMPRWKPAENSKGIKVKQDFEFLVLSAMEGC